MIVIGDNSKYEKPDDLKLPLEVIPLSDLPPIISHFPKPCINNLSPISDGSLGTSLMAQWLRLCLPGVVGSVSGLGAKIPHASWSKKHRNRKQTILYEFNKDVVWKSIIQDHR